MNKETLKLIGGLILCCLILIAIVIYIPKPESRRAKRRLPSKIVGTEYLKLAGQALSKTNKANGTTLQKLSQFASEEKIDISPLTAANIAAIDALAAADKSIKLCNEKLQKFNKEEASRTILIEANMKLIVSLNEISEIVKVLNIELQHVEKLLNTEIQHLKSDPKKEHTHFLPSSFRKVTDTIKKVSNATVKGIDALDETVDAYSAYYQLDGL